MPAYMYFSLVLGHHKEAWKVTTTFLLWTISRDDVGLNRYTESVHA